MATTLAGSLFDLRPHDIESYKGGNSGEIEPLSIKLVLKHYGAHHDGPNVDTDSPQRCLPNQDVEAIGTPSLAAQDQTGLQHNDQLADHVG